MQPPTITDIQLFIPVIDGYAGVKPRGFRPDLLRALNKEMIATSAARYAAPKRPVLALAVNDAYPQRKGQTMTRGRIASALSAACAVAASFYLVGVPVYRGRTQQQQTLLEVNGYRAAVALAFPILIACLPLVIRDRKARLISAILLVVYALLGSFTIGLFYLPAALVMAVACVLHENSHNEPGVAPGS